MGLFDKKYCDICGEKIGLLGNRKLEDGNLCKDCAAKLSPWFSERRRSTVEDIREQLAYREENRAAVDRFHTTRTLGAGTKVLLDEDAGLFMVTSARDLRDANPDVMQFSQVTGCRVDVDERRHELKHKDRDGKDVSYNPPRYTYEYDFFVIINVNTPYFDEIRFKLNSRSIESPTPISRGGTADARMGMQQPGMGMRPGMGMQQPGMGMPRSGMGAQQPGMPRSGMGAQRPGMPRPGMGMQQPGMPRPGMGMQQPGMGGIPVEYEECERLGEEIKAALTQVRETVRQSVAEANAPKAAVTCPWCGATTTADASGKCEYCGGALNG